MPPTDTRNTDGRSPSGALVPLGAHATPGPSTLAELAEHFLRWFQFTRARSEHTIRAYNFDLGSFVEFCRRAGVGDDPRRVRLRMIEAYLAWLRHERGLNPASANRARAALRAFFGYLVHEQVIDTNPVIETIGFKIPQRLPKRLTYREREHVLAVLAQDDTPIGRRDLAVTGCGCLAGLRCEEITTLRLEDLDLEARLLRVVGKGDKEREVPVVGRLCDMLARYLAVRPTLVGQPVGEMYRRTPTAPWRLRYGDVRLNTHTYSQTKARALLHELAPRVPDSPYVFVNASPRRGHSLTRGGRPLERRTLFAMIRSRVSPLVGRPVSPHVLRHTFASILTERGANPFSIQRLMGHVRLETTSAYVHLANDQLRDEIEKHL